MAGVGGERAGRQVNVAGEGGVIEPHTRSNRGAGRQLPGMGGSFSSMGELPKGRLDGDSGSKKSPTGLRSKARRSRHRRGGGGG